MRRSVRAGFVAVIVTAGPLAAQLPVTTLPADTLIPAGDERIERAGDLAVGQGGSLYLADNGTTTVTVLRADGSVLRRIGRKGSGPGEMQAIVWLSVERDTLRFLDPPRGATLVFDTAGRYVRQVAGFTSYASQGTAYDARGGALVGRHGIGGLLAQRIDPAGASGASLGHLVAPAQARLSPVGLKEDLLARRIPEAFRNFTFPVLDAAGGAWLVLNVDGSVQRYDAANAARWTTALPPEITTPLREGIFQRAAASPQGPPGFPNVIQWARANGEELWLLLRTEEGTPAEFLILDPRGRWRAHLRVPGATDIRTFAIDRERGLLYLVDPSEGTIVRASIPRALR